MAPQPKGPLKTTFAFQGALDIGSALGGPSNRGLTSAANDFEMRSSSCLQLRKKATAQKEQLCFRRTSIQDLITIL